MKTERMWPLLAALLMAVSTVAGAHAHLEMSKPADKSRVAAPKQIELTFSEAVQLTALTLQHGGKPAQPIESLSTESASGFVIPVQTLQPGEYVLTWTVATDDGHAATGKLRFTVTPAPGGN